MIRIDPRNRYPALLALMLLLALPVLQTRLPAQATATSGGEDLQKPVRVFIMLGQSNMLGFGKVESKEADVQGTLQDLVQSKGKYADLKDESGAWVTRDDVRYVHVMHRRGNMSVMRNEWLTPKGSFGPELGFGQVVGPAVGEPVLLLKSCIGNRSLGWDLLPPGSPQFEFEGKVYAAYGESPLSWDKGTEPKPIEWYAGKQYDDDVRNAKQVLQNLADYLPGYQGQGYRIAGFVWWQGHKDQNPAHASKYEENLVRLIESLRKDFESPEAKFLIATIAFGGKEISGPGLQIVNAQLSVDGSAGKYPEFKDNVSSVDARPFWRAADVSPNSRQGYHYFHNAETYMEVGRALGNAYLEMID